jgi:hypothetical protein
MSVAREYGECRSLTTFGEFSDLLRHPGHRIVLVQIVSPFRPGLGPAFSMSVPGQSSTTGVTAPLPATPFMAGSGAVDVSQDHAAPSVAAGSVDCAMAQIKPTSSRATAVTDSAEFLPRAIRRR